MHGLDLQTMKVLIIGGTSSLAKPILDKLDQVKCQITATYTRSSNIIYRNEVEWIKFNLSNRSSIRKLSRKFADTEFDLIMYFEGKTSNFPKMEVSKKYISRYLNTHLVNSIITINWLRKTLKEQSTFVYISSISAERGSYDPLYAAAKAGIHRYVLSLRNHLTDNQNIVIAVPSLISNSAMYMEMSEETVAKHKSNSSLIEVETLANVLWEAICNTKSNLIILDRFTE